MKDISKLILAYITVTSVQLHCALCRGSEGPGDILEWAESQGGRDDVTWSPPSSHDVMAASGDVTVTSGRGGDVMGESPRGESPGDLKLHVYKELGRQLVLGLLAKELHALRGSLQALPQPSPEPAAAKRYRPRGYFGSRGKRFLPGVASLLLARYYRDAKWKRQPHFGFHGSRG